jgi:hypothetical protein
MYHCLQRFKGLHVAHTFYLILKKIPITFIESSLLYGSETWRLTENNKRWVEATEMDALRRSSRISRKK